MKELDGLLSSLQYDNCSTFNDSILEFIYCGAIRKHPIKVMNPNPNIDYTGCQLQVIGENGKYTFSELIEKDYIKANRRLESSHIGFDIRDIYSPNNENKKQGRFSFQFEDMSMSNGAPNYRRILFFFALDTNPKRFKDYFKGAKEFELEDQGLYVLTFLNEEGVPSGFAYIYDRRLNVYYFANFRNGKLHGFVFSFGVKNRNYVFKNAFVYYDGKKTTILSSVLDELRKYNEKYNLTVISWS